MPSPRRGQESRSSFYRRLPLWFQWGFPFLIAIAAVVVIVVFVQDHQGQNGAEDSISPAAMKAGDKIGAATMRQQQRPHSATVAGGSQPAKVLEAAITKWVDAQTKAGQLNGPVKDANCTTVSGAGTDRVALKCTIKAAQVSYGFRGVVQPKLGKATFCQKIAYPPSYGEPTVALSPVCT